MSVYFLLFWLYWYIDKRPRSCLHQASPEKREKSTIFTPTRTFKNYSPSEFLKDIATLPWSVLEIFDDPGDKLFAFNVLFNDVLDKHAPVKTIRIRGRPNPYVTVEI